MGIKSIEVAIYSLTLLFMSIFVYIGVPKSMSVFFMMGSLFLAFLVYKGGINFNELSKQSNLSSFLVFLSALFLGLSILIQIIGVELPFDLFWLSVGFLTILLIIYSNIVAR